ncbi:3373_t:CDS:2, partial [Racocetra persica]
MSAMDGYVSIKYGRESYEPLELLEPNKPKTFKIYKQRGQYFKIGDDETYLEEIRNNQ